MVYAIGRTGLPAVVLAATMVLGGCDFGDATVLGTTVVATTSPAPTPASGGSYDDVAIDEGDIQALQRLLNDKWTYFLIEMDKYNLARSSTNDDAMVARMELVWADSFQFAALNPDGSAFGTSNGTHSPRSWLEAQNVDSWQMFKPASTLLVPNYQHILTVIEPGKRARLEGYHEHGFTGVDIRLAAQVARHLAFETIIFEKQADGWRVVDYQEVNYDMSEVMAPPLPPL